MAIDRQKFAVRERKMPEHLANLDKLVPATLRGAKMAVLEITDAVQVDAYRGNNKRTGEPIFEPAVALRFKEIPKRIYWVNKIGVNILCDVYGEDESEWVGNRVPLVVKEEVKNPTTGESQDMLWIANADEWETLFDAWEKTLEAKASGGDAKTVANDAAARARAAAEKRSRGKPSSSTPNASA